MNDLTYRGGTLMILVRCIVSSHQVLLRSVVAVVLVLVLSSGGLAQKKLLFDHLTVKQGLSQSSVMCVFQDRRGFMWFGTQDGLNRYDGYDFKIFKHDPANPNSLKENFVVLIAEDRQGKLTLTRDAITGKVMISGGKSLDELTTQLRIAIQKQQEIKQ